MLLQLLSLQRPDDNDYADEAETNMRALTLTMRMMTVTMVIMLANKMIMMGYDRTLRILTSYSSRYEGVRAASEACASVTHVYLFLLVM